MDSVSFRINMLRKLSFVFTEYLIYLEEKLILETPSSSSSLATRIEDFKDKSKEVTALLISINLGSKGVKLIEDFIMSFRENHYQTLLMNCKP